MQLTENQKKIISHNGDMKINAVAGSGKTSTLLEYARARPDKKMLYLVFNKSVKQESALKFQKNGITNVVVETAHSLAYKHIVSGSELKLKLGDYRLQEVIEILGIDGFPKANDKFIIASHVLKFLAYFCNSAALKFKDINYMDTLATEKAIEFVTNYYDYIQRYARQFMAKMHEGSIEITHDYYLKLFQLSNPKLDYDIILFDEGQDASGSTLDFFIKQPCVKVIVGDTHQQIYAWRYAVNSLEKVHFEDFMLDTSFRFGEEIAEVATKILAWKERFIPTAFKGVLPKVKGVGKKEKDGSSAAISRTNIGLLSEAITHVFKSDAPIYFEGNIQSYTYANEGTSLYDVLNLFTGNRKYIKDPMLANMIAFSELEDYIDAVDDVQLKGMVNIVKTYGRDLPNLIKKVKDLQVSDNEKHLASRIFSTVHKSKGMEYDEVFLTDDFLTYKKLKKMVGVEDLTPNLVSKINEEINLLYVAATRAKHKLVLPSDSLPYGISNSESVVIY